jgi:hypothetical protein
MFLMAGLANCQELQVIPEEPKTFENLVDIIYFPEGILIFDYDLDHDGKRIGDFRIGRVVAEKMQSPYGIFAKIRLRPSYYAVDFNKDGRFDPETELFIDIATEGERQLISYPQWLEFQEQAKTKQIT